MAPTPVQHNYVPFPEVCRVHPTDSRYAVINLRSIAHFLPASNLRTRIETWVSNPGNSNQFIIYLGSSDRLGPTGQFRTNVRGVQVLTALVVQAMGKKNASLCEYCQAASTSSRVKPVFTSCTSDRDVGDRKAGGLGACGNCVWNHKEATCMHCKFC